MTPSRFLVLWLPDWPVRAAFGAPPPRNDGGADAAVAEPGGSSREAVLDVPVAILQGTTVVACSAAARAQGVRRGQRRRFAQACCPGLRLLPADPGRDERVFLPVLRLLEEQIPGVQPLRPGLAALRARGAARYYGSEEAAGRTLVETLAAHGYPGARAGAAGSLFTAEQAARRADPVLVVPPGADGAFLAPLSVAVFDDPALAELLTDLGVHTLGAFAALREDDVRDRFGPREAQLHARATGADPRLLIPRIAEPELARELLLETPLALADQVAFAVRQTAEEVLDGLDAASLICTEVRIDLTDEHGAVASRHWVHPNAFTSAEIVGRVRWQLEALRTESPGSGGTSDDGDGQPLSAIAEVRIVPTRVDDSARHQPGLFGQGPGERLHHAVSRVQGMLGHRGVLVPAVGGGRRLADRQHLRPWGDPAPPERDPALPWPGRLPPPAPARVFDPPRPVEVLTGEGAPPGIDERGTLSAPPELIEGAAVQAWAGPWPLRERSWEEGRPLAVHRLQALDRAQRAWLLLHDGERWWAEARYD